MLVREPPYVNALNIQVHVEEQVRESLISQRKVMVNLSIYLIYFSTILTSKHLIFQKYAIGFKQIYDFLSKIFIKFAWCYTETNDENFLQFYNESLTRKTLSQFARKQFFLWSDRGHIAFLMNEISNLLFVEFCRIILAEFLHLPIEF